MLFRQQLDPAAKAAEASPPAAPLPRGNSAYQRKKERERARNAAASRSGRDIGELPPVKDPARRARALRDPAYFNRVYFPKRYTLKPSPDQVASVEALKRVVEEGGNQAFAAPRGDGKTTRCETLTIWAILTGKRRFIALIGATRSAASENLESIKGEFETNDILAEDFPEVCYPVRCLEGIHNKCKGQLYRGQPTRMKWSGDLIVLPTMPDSPASGAVFCCRGITGRVRGMKYRRPDGETVRPDLAIVDDPQTKRSAASPRQCKRRLEIITGDVLGLAGPGVAMACFVPCTVIERGDLADQILDDELFPAFKGVRNKLVYEWPTNAELWEEYGELRRKSLRTYGDGRLANAHYKKNRAAMDAGARVAWPERKDEGEISAIQNAMNLRLDRAATFDAEFQNEPRDETSDDERLMTAAEIEAKVSGLDRGRIPLACQHLTAMIDVQQRLLYWAACAWSPDFNGSCVDHGTWPEQGRSAFVYRDIGRTIQQKFPVAGVPGAIRAALDALIDELAKREFEREDGLKIRISRILVDSGNWADVVYQCCRESPHAAMLLPSKGMGIKSDRAPISEWKKHDGQLVGEEWMLGRVENKRAVRLLTFDTNYWKTRLHSGLATAASDRGCFTLFGRRGTDHEMIAAHVAAETRDKTFGRGRTVYVYKLRPEKPDNHLGDCLVANGVAASLIGCRLVGLPVIPKPKSARPRPRVSPLKC